MALRAPRSISPAYGTGPAVVLDSLIAAVSEEHNRESNRRASSGEQRRTERVKRLLAGELIDASGLGYDFDVHHIGAIAGGPGAVEAVRELAVSLDARLFRIHPEKETVWAWLGSWRGIDRKELARVTRGALKPYVFLALGEPAHGFTGWRLTHRQARAALPIARGCPGRLICYGNVPLLASALRDEVLASSLHDVFLVPLESERDGGTRLRQTLYAYFAAGRHVSSAAVTLGVSRQTVNKRLRTVEERIGRRLSETS